MDSVEPILQFCVLCDNIAVGPGAKSAFIGIFDSLLKPGPVPQFYVQLRWICGIGEHTSIIKILDPDLEPIFTSEEGKINLLHKAQGADARHGFVNFEFPKPGVYWIEIFLNGKTHTAIPLPVHKPEKPEPA